MEGAEEDNLWSEAPTDVLRSILSRLVAGDYLAFLSVCKPWRLRLIQTRPQYDSPFPRTNNTPSLMTLDTKSGDVEFFNPLYNVLAQEEMNIPELRDCRIRCARKGWLLMSKGEYGMFFINPASKAVIKLPDLLEREHNSYPAWTFSCPPDSSSSDCFVVGFNACGSPPPVCIIKVGEISWTYHDWYEDGIKSPTYVLDGCNNPVFSKDNTTIYVLCDGGTLGILGINRNSATEKPTWRFYGKSFPPRKRSSIKQVFTAAAEEDNDNGGLLLAVFLTYEEGRVEVWRYSMNGSIFERKQITSLGNNMTLFVSKGSSYMKPCVARGLGNAICFPMLRNNNGVFFSLANRKYCSFDYSLAELFTSSKYHKLIQPRSCIWMEPDE